MLKRSTLLLILSIVLFTTVFPTAAQDSMPRFEWTDIQNLAIPYDAAATGSIQLNYGYARERIGSPYVAPTDFILAEKHAFGDVNDDGLEDAVGILIVDPPGEVKHSYLLTVLNDNGAPNMLPLLYLGDREPVHFITIVPGEVGIRNRVHGDGDNPCCATLETALRYVFLNDGLHLIEEFVLYRQADVSPDVPADIVDYGLLTGTSFEPFTVQSEHDSLSVTLDGRIAYGEVEYFQFLGRSGQQLSIRLSSPNHNVRLSLYDPERGRTLSSGNNDFRPTAITGTLPFTQPYVIRVESTTLGDTDFRLAIQAITISP